MPSYSAKFSLRFNETPLNSYIFTKQEDAHLQTQLYLYINIYKHLVQYKVEVIHLVSFRLDRVSRLKMYCPKKKQKQNSKKKKDFSAKTLFHLHFIVTLCRWVGARLMAYKVFNKSTAASRNFSAMSPSPSSCTRSGEDLSATSTFVQHVLALECPWTHFEFQWITPSGIFAMANHSNCSCAENNKIPLQVGVYECAVVIFVDELNTDTGIL